MEPVKPNDAEATMMAALPRRLRATSAQTGMTPSVSVSERLHARCHSPRARFAKRIRETGC
jgi:hypothetical protein